MFSTVPPSLEDCSWRIGAVFQAWEVGNGHAMMRSERAIIDIDVIITNLHHCDF